MSGPPYSQTETDEVYNSLNNGQSIPLFTETGEVTPLNELVMVADWRNLQFEESDYLCAFNAWRDLSHTGGDNIYLQYYQQGIVGSPNSMVINTGLGSTARDTFVVGVDIPSKYIKAVYDGVNVNFYDENGALLSTYPYSGGPYGFFETECLSPF